MTTPTAEQLREFYPISKSIPNEKITQLYNYVKNVLFVKMFGYEAANKIFSEEIPSSATDSFIGFQKFAALCCAYQEIKDPMVSTNFGLKVIDRQGTKNPTNNEKGISVIPLEEAISIHYRQALKYVGGFKCVGVPNWGGYYSYKVTKL